MSLPQVLAETLRDPTQPPVIHTPKTHAASDRTRGAHLSALRSIRIGAQDKVATIGGARVRVGDFVGTAKVMAIRPTEVVLRDASGTSTLKLYPGVQKHAPDSRLHQMPLTEASNQVATRRVP